MKTAAISGFSDGTVYALAPTAAGGAPQNLNLGTDWFATGSRGGVGYFDNVVVAIPEPAGVGVLTLAGMTLLRRRRA